MIQATDIKDVWADVNGDDAANDEPSEVWLIVAAYLNDADSDIKPEDLGQTAFPYIKAHVGTLIDFVRHALSDDFTKFGLGKVAKPE